MNKYEPLPPISSHDNSGELTIYRTDYTQHEMQRPFVHHPDEYVKPQGDFANQTSYKQEYVGKYNMFV